MPQKKVLIVDDDPEMRLALSLRLRANHYAVTSAVDGVSAIAEARRVPPDAILLDLGLPAGDGFIVLERLKEISSLAAVPVIVLSGRNRSVNQGRALEAGAHIFLQKPVKNCDLLSAIEHAISCSDKASAVVYELNNPADSARS